uniref:Uncharacterized protein n=1 Tax=Stomoxys calcitrans TaxID=35570 RepID=A0A1I8NWT8_STOCA
MKIFIYLFIALMAIQLSLSSPTPELATTLAPFDQKRYDIFDAILIQMNNISSSIVLEQTSTYPKILKDYNEWLLLNKANLRANNETHVYEELKESLENVVNNSENFVKNRQNCELQRQMQSSFFNVVSLVQKIENEEVHQIWHRHQQQHPGKLDDSQVDEEIFRKFLQEFNGQFENFQNGLNEVGREENKALIKWHKELQSKTDFQQQLEVFEDVHILFEKEMERETKAGKLNCRFQVFQEWRKKHLEIMALALSIALKAFGNLLFGGLN